MADRENFLKGKFVLEGKIQLLSPALIGSGEGENTDIDVLLDSNKNPFIPATSFIGVIREFLASYENKNYLDLLGKPKNENYKGRQSYIKCSDLKAANKNIQVTVRDGIKIDNKTGIVEEGAKYDFEVIDRNAEFNLRMEADYYSDNEEEVVNTFALIKKALVSSKLSIGAKTNSGLGLIQLKDDICYKYDFSNKKDIVNWLKKNKGAIYAIPDVELIPSYNFEMDINLKLKNSIIVKSYPSDPSMPDAVHIQSDGKYVLPGTSIKGAVRARAERILNTLNDEKKDEFINSLFGIVDTEKKDSKAVKGRIKVEEKILPSFIAEIQSRIKIDRFTGGTINGALV